MTMAKNDVTTKHPDYKENYPIWEMCEDAAGTMHDDEDRTKYILQPNPTDTSKENKARYKQYKARAVWYAFTARTLAGMVGAAFRKPPTIEVPAAIDYIKTDVDGAGVGVAQQSQASLLQVLTVGRAGLLVDFPETDGEVSRATLVSKRLQPFIRQVEAEDVINWRAEAVDGKTVLTLVVIAEEYSEPSGFGAECGTQYRVLRLVAGVYLVEIWRKLQGTNDWFIFKTIVPQKSNGSPFPEIPFFFIGSENNDADVDAAPSFDLAQLNIAHFRNSADYEDSVYLVGQPQVYLSGLDQNWVDMLEKKGLYLGSRSILPLPSGGTAGMLQAQPNTLCKEAMDQKEKQAIALGARLVEQGTVAKTATQAGGELNVQHSVLSLCVGNVSEAYTKAINAMLEFAGVSGKVVFEINREFVELTLDAQMLTALIAAWQSGKFPEGDLWANLKKYGIIDPKKSDDQIKNELEASAPAGPNLAP